MRPARRLSCLAILGAALLLESNAALGLESAPAAAPLALSSCTGGSSGPYYALAQKQTYDTAVFGVSAQIQRQDVALCDASSGSPDWVSTWNMLIPRTPNDQYAQVGWIKIGSAAPYSISGYHTFSENSKSCYPSCAPNSNVVFNYGSDPSGTLNYQVYLRASDDRIVMRAGSTIIDVMNRDVSGEWSNDWSGQWASEVHYHGSDIPGTVDNKLWFDYIKYYDSSGSTNYIQNFSTPYVQDSRFHISLDSSPNNTGKRIRLWTDPL